MTTQPELNEPCQPWPIDTTCDPTFLDLDEFVQARSVSLAWRTLHRLTGGQVGACPVVLRPCAQPPCSACSTGWMNPRIVAGDWVNFACGDGCGCRPLCSIVLPSHIADIIDVTVNGDPFDLTGVRVENGNEIVRTDGGCFPACQDMSKAPGTDGTFEITYVPGYKPGMEGAYAAGVLASEYAKACNGGKCRLPSGITTLVQQGRTMMMSAELFPNGLTGIREVDAYVHSINPKHLTQPSVVWSPDMGSHKHRTVTWSAG
jgi:hypothetical protein